FALPVFQREGKGVPADGEVRDLLVVGVVRVWAQVAVSSVFQRQGIASKKYPLVVGVVEVCAQVDALGAPVLQREGKGVPADGEVRDLLVVGVVKLWAHPSRASCVRRHGSAIKRFPLVFGVAAVSALYAVSLHDALPI